MANNTAVLKMMRQQLDENQNLTKSESFQINSFDRQVLEKLFEQSKETLELLVYCSYFDHENFISFNILNHLFKLSSIKKALKKLTVMRLIEINYSKNGIKLDKRINIKSYGRETYDDNEIIPNIVDTLNDCIQSVNEADSYNINNEPMETEFYQLEKILNLIDNKSYSINPLKIANLKQKLGYFYLYYLNRADKALEIFFSANKILEKAFQDENDRQEKASSLIDIGICYKHFDNYKEALNYFLKAYEMQLRLFKGDHPFLVSSLNNLGAIYLYFGNSNAALDYFLKAYDMSLRLNKNPNPDLARTLNNIGISYSDLGETELALEYHFKGFEMQSKLFDIDHPDLASSLNNIGACYSKLNDNEKALEFYMNSYEIKTRLFKNDHTELASSLSNIGASYAGLGDFKTALNYNLKTYEMMKRLYNNSDNCDMASSLNNLGVSYTHLGDHKKALEYYLNSYDMRLKLFKENDHPDLALSLNNIGVCYGDLGDHRKAVDYKSKSYAMKSRLYGDTKDHPDLILTLKGLRYSIDKLLKDLP